MGRFGGTSNVRQPRWLRAGMAVAAGGVSLAVGLAGTGVAKNSQVLAATTAPTDDWFTGVSCVSRRDCTAVGSLENVSNGAQVVLAERWNGNYWSAQRIPRPSYVSELDSVSCPTKRTCIAVGQYFRSSKNKLHNGYFGWGSGVGLAERWNGRNWSIQHPVNPGGNSGAESGLNFLLGVSCGSATSCTAVGSYSGPTRFGGGTLAEHWNGKRWSVQRTPASTGLGAALSGVSCPSARFCVAVGTTLRRTVAERWNGKKWSLMHLPTPAHTKDAALTSVDCVSTTACRSVGYFTTRRLSYASRIPATGMAERWNGTKWTVRPLRAVKTGAMAGGVGGVGLTSESCAASDTCIAVGGGMAELMRGTRWSTVQDSALVSLAGVSCPSTRMCIGVGSGPAGTLAERWNGKRWSTQRTPNPGL